MELELEASSPVSIRTLEDPLEEVVISRVIARLPVHQGRHVPEVGE